MASWIRENRLLIPVLVFLCIVVASCQFLDTIIGVQQETTGFDLSLIHI